MILFGFLSFALLCGAPSALQAQSAFPLFSGEVEQANIQAGEQYLAEAELRMRMVRLAPIIDLSRPVLLELFDDVRYTVQLERSTVSALPWLEVWKGRVADDRFTHLPQYRNTVLVLNRRTGRLVANIETDRGFFQVLPTATAGTYRVRQCLSFNNQQCSVLEGTHPRATRGASRSDCGGDCNETDADGRFVVDVFAGYSSGAALVASDLDAHAQANIETVNMGLANSLVDEVYLRLVGTGTTPHNPGIVTSVLEDAWNWFAAEIEATAPDMLVVFQTPTNAPGSAGGWGYMPGRASVGGVAWPTVYRHEAGHNAGGAHCYPDNENHQNGYDNGHWRTHLCGNDVNFYSTPLVNDDQGNPIGDANEADMARTWRETAFTMASYAMHKVPYHENDECLGLTCFPEHWGNPIEYINMVYFNTLLNEQSDPSWVCTDITGYSDYRQLSTQVMPGETHELYAASTVSWAESTLRAWIDWNADGTLAPEELVMDLSGEGPWATMVTVPPGAVEGPLRLRIRLQYGLDSQPDPCAGSGYSSGETEDYTVEVVPAVNVGIAAHDVRSFSISPNPVADRLTIAGPGLVRGVVLCRLLNALGQEVKVQQVHGQADMAVDVAGLPAGLYTCELRNVNGERQLARFVKE